MNEYMNNYFKHFIQKFRTYNDDQFDIKIFGIKCFVNDNEKILNNLLKEFKHNKFNIEVEGEKERLSEIEIICKNNTNNSIYNFNYQIQSLPHLCDLSSRTKIPIIAIVIMKIVALIISKVKILYKAIILDLDDTLWKGTLLDDGYNRIEENMKSEIGSPFIEFMNFVKCVGNELGIYIAICSRNDSKLVEFTLNNFDSSIFPLKNQIDFIIANDNDKSVNIKIIARHLSILPNSIVFIDDNQLVRDEVKNNLPGVFTPDWKNHSELMSQLIASCVFERVDLSQSTKNRKKQFKIIQAERKQNSLPELFIKVNDDKDHIQAKELYSKSNQFKLVSEEIEYSNTKSLYFEVYRQNGDNLGIGSVITYYSENNSKCAILNWAISCRYFEIGLEEFIILYFIEIIADKEVYFAYENNESNQKVEELINKYYGEIFTQRGDKDSADLCLSNNNLSACFVQLLAKLQRNNKNFNIYWTETFSLNKNLLKMNTNLKLL